MGAAFKLTDAIDDNIVRKLKLIGEQSEETAQSYAKLVVQMGEMTKLNPKGLDELQQKAAKYNDTAKELRETQSKLNQLQKEQSELYKKVAKDIEAQVKAQTAKAKLEGQMLANEQKRLRNQQLLEKQNRKTALSEEQITNALSTQAKTMQQAMEQNRLLRQAMRETDLTAADSAEKMELYSRKIMENEELLDKNSDAMIQRKRNIGNYASAWNGLGASVQQVARELPSLSMGFNTFFLAISNNLPLLVDELRRASDEVKALKANNAEAVPVWKQLTKAIFNWQTALVVGITVLSAYGDEIVKWATGLFNSSKQVDSFKQAQENINESMKQSGSGVGEQIAKVKSLSEQWKSLGGDLDAQKKFINDNKDAFNDLGVEVTTVKDAENLLVTNTDAFIQSMIQRAQAAAGMKLAAETYEKALQKQIEADKMADTILVKDVQYMNTSAGGMMIGTGETYAVENDEKKKALEEIKSLNELAESYLRVSNAKQQDSKSTLENAGIQEGKGADAIKAAEDAAKQRIEIEKALRDSRIAIMKDEEEREIAELKASFEDKKAEYIGNSEEELEIRKNLEIQLQEGILNIRAEYAKKRKEQEEKSSAEIEKQRKILLSKELDSIESSYAASSVESTVRMQEAMKVISDRYAQGLIDQERYEQLRYDITKDYGVEQAKIALEMLKEQLQNEKLTQEERLALKQKVTDAELALNDEIIASNEEAANKAREDWEKISGVFADFSSQAEDMVAGLGSVFDGIFGIFKEIAEGGKISVENILQSVSAIVEGISEIVGNMYESQIEELEKQEEANEVAKDKELARIDELAEHGAISEEEAEARKRAAEDKTAKKNEEVARKKAELQEKQARLEKSANIVQTIMNTAVAIMKAWSQGGIFAAPMAAMIAAMGAVQLATIVAQPIPKYAKGTKGHKGGLAIVGDGGVSETVITERGMYLTPSTPTLVDLPKGAKVLPYAIDMERIKAKANDLEGLMAYRHENELPPITIENDYSGLQKDIKALEASQRKGFKELAKVIKNQDYKRFAASI